MISVVKLLGELELVSACRRPPEKLVTVLTISSKTWFRFRHSCMTGLCLGLGREFVPSRGVAAEKINLQSKPSVLAFF